MYAIIDTCGKQYRVKTGDVIQVDRLNAEVGTELTFHKVLMVGGEEVKIGTPHVDGAGVKAKVASHELGEKVLTFKYRPTRRQRRRVGFRHSHTTLVIVGINA